MILAILEPAGLFTFWVGGETIFYRPIEKNPDLDFYTKMFKAEIIFESY